MKKLFVMMLSAAFIASSAAAKMPARVTDAFQARYSNASNVEWDHLVGKYKARFNVGEYRLEAKFNGKGKWLESEKMLEKDRLPETVKNSLKKSKYSQWHIKSSFEEYLPHKKPIYHITAAKGDFKRKALVFNHLGQLMDG